MLCSTLGTIHWTFCSSVFGWLLNVWELGDEYSQFEMNVRPIGDGECFFEFWKMSFRMHGRNLTWPHCFTRWDLHRLRKDWKGETFSFSQDKKTIASIFGAGGLLLKVHQGVCNPGISPHQIFQTRVEIMEEEKAIDSFEKLKDILSNVLILTIPKWYEPF